MPVDTQIVFDDTRRTEEYVWRKRFLEEANSAPPLVAKQLTVTNRKLFNDVAIGNDFFQKKISFRNTSNVEFITFHLFSFFIVV